MDLDDSGKIGSGLQILLRFHVSAPFWTCSARQQMVSRSEARQIKAKRSLAWQIFSHVRFVIVASVHDISVRISFKEICLTGFVDNSCFDHLGCPMLTLGILFGAM